jgi:acetyl esterase/lipase
MQPADVLSRPARAPDITVSYGPLADHVADLWLPPDEMAAPAALILFLHGGFWRSAYDRRHTGPFAEAMAADGFAVCSPEYRRVGQPSGGWPGTFDDIRSAVTTLPALLAQAAGGRIGRIGRIDRERVVLAGHSAGGHLALWAAGPLGGVPVPAAGAVISLAGVSDLAACYRQGLGSNAARDLLGGSPEDFPDRYAAADPSGAIPIGVPVSLIHGTADDRVPWEQSRDFGDRASAAGDEVSRVLLPGTGHFELIDPLSAAWPSVRAEFRAVADRLSRRS